MVVARWLVPAVSACLLLASQAGAQGATGTVRGTVVDSTSRQPIPGVTVVVEGTPRGTLTRDDGSYQLPVPPGTQRLRVTRIGYAPQTRDVSVSAGASVTADFQMRAQSAILQQVVVTGYGTQRREAITGSVSTVEVDQANVGVVANPNGLIAGRVAGVQVTTNNGEPGGGVQMRIRGGTSLSASNEPLYVIDGVPLQNEAVVAGARELGGIRPPLSRSPLNTINPNDIETITILKDASATAIYGSRGANGVILITTKSGSARNSVIEYDTYVSTSMPARSLDILTGSEYRAFVQQQVTAGALPASRLASLGTADTDWEDEMTRSGFATNHNLAFSGGSQTTQYRASLNYFQQEGVVISNGMRRYQGRLNGEHQALNGRVRLGLNLTASRVNNDYLPFENTGGFEGGVFTNMLIFDPTRPVTVTDPATGQQVYYEIGAGAQSTRNPVALAQQVEDIAPENRILGNVTGTVALHPSLTSQTTLGADYTDALRQTYFPKSNPVGAQYNGIARQAQRNLQNLNFQQLLTFNPDIGSTHDFDIVGGYEYSKFDNSGFEAIMQGFITDAFRWNNLAAGTLANSPSPGSYQQSSKLVSFFSRANYGLQGKYFLTGVVRYDGSSRLAPGNQWSVFPALSGSWRVSEEAFFPRNMLSSLALRAGWGLQGNQAVRPYATQLLLRADQGARYPFGTGITTGLVAAQVANPDLKWETSEQINIGIDYGFMNDRFLGVIDFYQKTTRDLLLDVSVPQPAVVSTRVENVGSIRNKGVELSLDADILTRGARTFSSGLVASIERNEVLDLGGDRTFIVTGGVSGQGQSGRNSQRIIVGEPIGTA
jgi:TonB-dependent starch-binding outer membrane protein SusC